VKIYELEKTQLNTFVVSGVINLKVAVERVVATSFIGDKEFVVLEQGQLNQTYHLHQYRALSEQETFLDEYKDLPLENEDQTLFMIDLLNLGLYKCLASHIANRRNFKVVGALRQELETKLSLQKENDLKLILQATKTLPTHDNFKRVALVKRANRELEKLRGFQTIYIALLKRQTEIAIENQTQMRLPKMRAEEKEEIAEIQAFMTSELGKRISILQAVKYFANTDLLTELTTQEQRLK